MKVKLKTIEQLIEEFGFKSSGRDYRTNFNGMHWHIHESMFRYLGNDVNVERLEEEIKKTTYYTHRNTDCGRHGWYWHELWFEPEFVPIEFINEDEFEI